MSAIKTATLASLVLVLLCGLAGAQTTAPPSSQAALEAEALKNCDANQMSLNLCSFHRYKKVDAELNRIYQAHLARMSSKVDVQRYREAQRAWLKYAEADCLYRNGPREESGTIWPLLQNTCLSEHTEARLRVLRQHFSCTQDGCPGN